MSRMTCSTRLLRNFALLGAVLSTGCGGDGTSAADAGGQGDIADAASVDATSVDANTVDAGPWLDPSTFVAPAELAPDGDGVYQLRMEAGLLNVDGANLCLRTFNGAASAPIMRVAASATRREVRINLVNAAATVDQQTVGANTFDFNALNFHAPGLKVSPEITTDGLYFSNNSLLSLQAGDTAEYRLDLDELETHEAGTFWYRSNLAGRSAIHTGNGMAGALIVEGPVDSLAGLSDSLERIFVMTHIPVATATPLADGVSCDFDALSVNSLAAVSASPTEVQVNGISTPRIAVHPGQVERWRLIHAGVHEDMDLALHVSTDDSCSDIEGSALPMQQIAQDGISFAAKRAVEHLYMAPGNRADLMVSAPAEAGVYCLSYQQVAGPRIVVAILETDRAAPQPTGALPSDADLASVATPPLDCAAATGGTQSVTLSQLLDPNTGEACEGGSLNINCFSFNPAAPRVLTLGQRETWNVTSQLGEHALHLPIAFTVCSGSVGGEALTPEWRDTLPINQAGATSSLIVDYGQHSGLSKLMNSHLPASDLGMAELLQIAP